MAVADEGNRELGEHSLKESGCPSFPEIRPAEVTVSYHEHPARLVQRSVEVDDAVEVITDREGRSFENIKTEGAYIGCGSQVSVVVCSNNTRNPAGVSQADNGGVQSVWLRFRLINRRGDELVDVDTTDLKPAQEYVWMSEVIVRRRTSRESAKVPDKLFEVWEVRGRGKRRTGPNEEHQGARVEGINDWLRYVNVADPHD